MHYQGCWRRGQWGNAPLKESSIYSLSDVISFIKSENTLVDLSIWSNWKWVVLIFGIKHSNRTGATSAGPGLLFLYRLGFTVNPLWLAKSRNSAGVNFCTRCLQTTTITWHLHAPVRCYGQTGKVPLYNLQGEMPRVDGATKEISIHPSNIDTTIYMLKFLSHCRVRSLF